LIGGVTVVQINLMLSVIFIIRFLIHISRVAGCREDSSTTRVVNYSSNFLLLEYSLISISACKFPFPVEEAADCSQLVNC